MQRSFVALLLFVAVLYVSYAEGDNETHKCQANETWSLCGRMCEPTCAQPHPNRRFCPRIVCSTFTAACRCKQGYLRDVQRNNQCVMEKDCGKA